MIEIRTLNRVAARLSPTQLAALLTESEMALGMPCVVNSIGEAARLLGLTDRQCAALQDTLSRGGLWKGQAAEQPVVVRLAKEAC